MNQSTTGTLYTQRETLFCSSNLGPEHHTDTGIRNRKDTDRERTQEKGIGTIRTVGGTEATNTVTVTRQQQPCITQNRMYYKKYNA